MSTSCAIDWSSALLLSAVEAYFTGRVLRQCKDVMLVLHRTDQNNKYLCIDVKRYSPHQESAEGSGGGRLAKLLR